MAVILWDNVVASQMNGVSARDLEEDLLTLTDNEVKGLLVVLYEGLDKASWR